MNYFLIVPAAVIGLTLGYICPGTDKERKVFAALFALSGVCIALAAIG